MSERKAIWQLPRIAVASLALAARLQAALSEERLPANVPVRVAVYDVPPYGIAGANGVMSGVSVDLWRRVAQELAWD